MTDAQPLPVSSTLRRWWVDLLRLRARDYLVLGPRRDGATTFFRAISAEDEDVVHWPMRGGVARLRTVEQVRQALWDAIGSTPPGAADPDRSLATLLDELFVGRTTDLVLVVDDWSSAVESVSDACYEVLIDLALYAGHTQLARGRAANLALVFVTEMLNRDDVQYLARRTQRPAFDRLSGIITRLFHQSHVPFLDREEAVQVCLDLGVERADAESIAAESGGWLWLLQACCAAAVDAGGWFAVDVGSRHRIVTDAIAGAVLPVLMRRPAAAEKGLDGFAYLADQLTRGAPQDVGVPAAFAADGVRRTARPAPLVAAVLVRRVMLVDVENIRMPFHLAERDAIRRGGLTPYPPGAHEFLKRRFAEWIPTLRDRFRVEPDDVWFCGQSTRLINRTIGDIPGQRIPVPRAVEHKEHLDDMRLGMTAVDVRRLHPSAHVLVVAEDGDTPLMLAELGILDRQVTVVTPWAAPERTRRLVEEGGATLDEHSFPAARPLEAGPDGRAPRGTAR